MNARPYPWLSGLRLIVLLVVIIGLVHWHRALRSTAHAQDVNQPPLPASLFDFTVADIDDKPVALSTFRGKVLLIVNVASKCGFTGQYAGLQKLYETYRDRGLVILGFPSNDFLWQEPGSNAEIKSFCSLTYKVTFPLFAKISVKGEDKHQLYRFLTDASRHAVKVDEISWNFNKFLIDRSGKVLAQYGSTTDPQSPELRAALEAALNVPTASESSPGLATGPAVSPGTDIASPPR